MTDIGYISLLLAFVVSIYAAVAGTLGARGGFPELVHSARRGVYAVCGLVTLSVLLLINALVTSDFGLRYVWQYTSSDMDLLYRVAAVYAGNDGSLLFWAWVLSLLGAITIYTNREERTLSPYVIAVTMATAAFFLLLIGLVANPFERLPSVPPEGHGMNPMLENVGMLLHPPTLFLGYVGLTIPFAFAVAALASGRLDGEWLRRTRVWAVFAWLMLGIGNILGAQWAYTELGWGGYWVWDPVENASLMPWLIITAYLHAAVVRRRLRLFKVWSVGLVAGAFLLSIFGTFLTRTGIVSSVHAFGQSALGPFFLTFLALGLGLTVGLVLWRWRDLHGEDEIDAFMSRENWVLITNLILVGITIVVFFGTLYPLISQVIIGRQVELGPDFYNQVTGPILLAMIVVMGVCPILAWRRSAGPELKAGLIAPAIGALAVAIVLVAIGIRHVVAVVGLGVCVFVILAHAGEWYRATRARQRSRGENAVAAFGRMVWGNRSRYGGHLVHISVAVMAIGVIGSSFFVLSTTSHLKPGESMSLAGYSLRYEGMAQDSTPSRDIVSATLTVSQNGRQLGQMEPNTVFHRSFQQPVSNVAIHTTVVEDLYVIFAGWDADGSASFKVLINPLVVWIWIGGGLMLLGGVIALWPEARAQTARAPEDGPRRAATAAGG